MGLGLLRRLRASAAQRGAAWVRSLNRAQRSRLSANLRRILDSKKVVDAQIRRER
jgi:hypothetical protein